MDEVQIVLSCASCGALLVRSPHHDKNGKQAYRCDAPHPGVPVLVAIKVTSQGQEPIEA